MRITAWPNSLPFICVTFSAFWLRHCIGYAMGNLILFNDLKFFKQFILFYLKAISEHMFYHFEKPVVDKRYAL